MMATLPFLSKFPSQAKSLLAFFVFYLLSQCSTASSFCAWPKPSSGGEFALSWWLSAPVYTPKTTIHFACPAGQTPVSKSSMVCQPSGEWQGTWQGCQSAATAKAAKQSSAACNYCLAPNSTANGRITSPLVTPQNYAPGDHVDYACNEGFFMSSPARITCLETGQWSDSAPTCSSTFQFENAQKLCPVQTFHGQAYPGVQRPLYARYVGSAFVTGAKLSFSCHHGHVIQGTRSIECLESGKWSGKVPNCVRPPRLHCPNPPPAAPLNAQVVGGASLLKRVYLPGSSVTYQCNSNFVPVGVNRLFCRANGTWSKQTPALVCNPITTTTPTTTTRRPFCAPIATQIPTGGPLNATFVQASWTRTSRDAEEESKYLFSCSAGYKLVGDSSMVCVRGKWVGSVPSCALKARCESITNKIPSGVEFKLTKVPGPLPNHPLMEPGSKLEFSCKPGYKLIGDSQMVCLQGKWTGSIPTCSLMPRCPPIQMADVQARPALQANFLAAPINLVPGHPSVEAGSKMTFSCKNGYDLVGDQAMVCVQGKWVGEMPRCELKPRCSTKPSFNDPKSSLEIKQFLMPNGTVYQQPMAEATLESGSKLAFGCRNFPDSELAGGDHSLVCVRGQWVGTVPTCRLNLCSQIDLSQLQPTRTGLRQSFSRDWTFFSCDDGYTLSGNERLPCIKAKWHGEVPKCVPKPRCPSKMSLVDPKSPLQVQFVPGGNSSSSTSPTVETGSKMVFRCNEGYNLIGDSAMVCVHGNWVGTAPRCELKMTTINPCSLVPPPGEHMIVRSSQYGNPATVTYACIRGYELTAPGKIKCVDGHWQKRPACKKRQQSCRPPPRQDFDKRGFEMSQDVWICMSVQSFAKQRYNPQIEQSLHSQVNMMSRVQVSADIDMMAGVSERDRK